ncbi:MAG: hypothetical protein IJW58_03525 [Clostridia bacterium]|nr:hypothetical protein [Clostridia bacterium]
MKKLAIILTCCFLFLGSSCNYIKYAKYPKVDIDCYEGNRYTSDDIFSYEGYFMVYDNIEIVGRYLDLINCWSIAYFSNRDVEKNWLTGNGYNQMYANCLKEGFELPNILEVSIMEARIPYRNIESYSIGVEVKADDSVVRFENEMKLSDILDAEIPYEDLEIENGKRSCYFVLEEYPYLAWGLNSALIVYNDNLYFSYYGAGLDSSILKTRYYKIKNEHQERFKTAYKYLQA